MDRPNVTLITGLNRTIKLIYPLHYASIGLPYLAFATFNERLKDREIDVITLNGIDASSVVQRYIRDLETFDKREIRHLIVAGDITSEQAVSMTHGNINLHVIYIAGNQSCPITDTEKVLKHWQTKKQLKLSLADKTRERLFVKIESHDSFSDQVVYITGLLDIPEIVKRKILHRICRDDRHEAHQFVRYIDTLRKLLRTGNNQYPDISIITPTSRTTISTPVVA